MLPKNPNDDLSFFPQNISSIYLGGGCFWGIEAYMKRVLGVFETEVGYANGNSENPTYEDVCTNTTGFAEVVLIKYDKTKVSLEGVVKEFLSVCDPISLSGQVQEVGTQYRSGIYYENNEEEALIKGAINEFQSSYDQKIGIEVQPIENYYSAEAYHQNYLEKNAGSGCSVRTA